MADKFRIDSHKLMFHPRRVTEWLDGKPVSPIYLELSPTGACNHRCVFCGMDFMGHKPNYLELEDMKPVLAGMGRVGVKSIMYCGEGEPFMHRRMVELAVETKKAGIDVSLTSNGVLFTPDKARDVLSVASWIKISCNAGTADTYARIHGTDPSDFYKFMDNIAEAVKIRAEQGSTCTIGVQMLLLSENMDEAVKLGVAMRDFGVDYMVIKPYSVHRQSTKDVCLVPEYACLAGVAAELDELNTTDFKIIFRHEAMRRKEFTASYDKCLALPFWGYVDSGGDFWGCLRHIGEQEFNYGNIFTSSFEELIASRRLPDDFSIEDCHLNCRMDLCNEYLWELRHPGPHVNFI
ncbi:radical SAM protein [Desulfovibrio sp. JC022]|uniref:radical SAM protein n=1 Tax=Desulfovibrio sp. JC022 TaxID=2593642 RepID=UPI0013D7F0CC|nr:radical SAM protein [Desulfovibrio sp. JC022]NDV22221.1 radical SAM protein [Desulfovibrio sp. JC022]